MKIQGGRLPAILFVFRDTLPSEITLPQMLKLTTERDFILITMRGIVIFSEGAELREVQRVIRPN